MNKTDLQAAAFENIDELLHDCVVMEDVLGSELADAYFNEAIRKILFNYYELVRDNG